MSIDDPPCKGAENIKENHSHLNFMENISLLYDSLLEFESDEEIVPRITRKEVGVDLKL